MKSTKYLLIGGGLASSQAAKQLREHDPQAGITLVAGEPHVPYDRPPLSKEFLRGEKPRQELFFDPESFFQDQRINLALGTAVKSLEPTRKTATLVDGDTIAFEKALIATGGRPVHPDIPGSSDLSGIYYLRTLDDSAAIAAESGPGKRAVIIGAGFIGIEVAASLTQRGVKTTVIESQSHIWHRFADATLAGFFQDYCSQKGVAFFTGEKVTAIEGKGRATSVLTESGNNFPCDFVCIGVGIVPNVELGREAGLEINNGIVVNEYLRSSHPDIYAAGDVANYFDPVFNKRRRVEHWGHAEYCGQLAGRNMAGGGDKYDLLTYVWSDIFDLHLEFAGDESEQDRIFLRGRFENKSFIVLYLKQNVLMAYFAVNTASKEFPSLQRLIRQKKNLAGKEAQLQDPAFSIKQLL